MTMYGLHANISFGVKVLERLVKAAQRVAKENGKPVILINVIGKDKPQSPIDNCQVLDANDAQTLGKLKLLGSGDAALVYTKSIPQPLFHLLGRNGSLPLLLEGAGTASFVQNLGIPFLTVKNNTSLPKDISGYEPLEKAANTLDTDNVTEQQIKDLVQIFKDSRTESTELFNYYSNLKKSRRAPEKDQMAQIFALLEDWK